LQEKYPSFFLNMVIYLDVLCSGSYGYGSIPLASTFLDEHYTDCWFQTCLFSIIYGIILPIDELIFFKRSLKPPTSKNMNSDGFTTIWQLGTPGFNVHQGSPSNEQLVGQAAVLGRYGAESPEKGKPITLAGAWFFVRRNFEMIVPHP